MAISSPGIGSGLDISGIITKLMTVEAQPLNLLNTKEASYQSRISALGSLQGAVSSLDTALAALVPSGSRTPTTTATIDNSAAAFVTASADAVSSTHQLEINQLAAAQKIATVAQSQQLASGIYGNASSAIATGTLNLSVGGAASVPITINAGNATLTGLKNAINAAGAGVTADIVPATGGVRLIITSNTIGTAGKVTTSGLTDFDFNGTTGTLSEDPLVGGRSASGYNSATASIATGTLSIQVGSGAAKQVIINGTNNTLAGLKDAINGAGAGVTAELVTVSANNIRLVLTANSSGASNTITTSGLTGFDFNGGTGSLSQSSGNGGQSPQDAIIKVDGTTITTSSNTTTTAISGVTLTLAATTSSAATVKVTRSDGLTFAEQAAAKFSSYKASVGNSSVAAATATSSAAIGSYALEVTQLATTHRITTPAAQAHQITTAPPKAQTLRSGTYATTTTDVTNGVNDGTLDIAVGGGAAVQIAVLAGTTLDGLKTLINNANAGVTASVVSDGTSYRLALVSNIAGASGAITTTNGGGLAGFDYDSGTATGTLAESQAATGYSSSADTIATGTISIAVGNGTATDITIDGSNNTLAGLRDAINNTAGIGVTASIVTDGLGVRLVMKSDTIGRDGALTISGLAGFEFNSTTKNLSDAAADGGQTAQGMASSTATVPTGTLKLTLGEGIAHNITIDSSNNTLDGLKNAINAGSYGVTATLLTVSSSDVRLVLTSNTIGTAGRISLSGLSGFSFDPGTGTGDFSQALADGGTPAQGSIIKLNGVTITGDSNTITNALQGVTLSLTGVSTSATTLSVSQDKTSAMSTAFASIVKAFNDLNTNIRNLGSYDATTKQGGVLLGNSTLRMVSSSIRNIFQSATTGSTGNYKRLSDLGLAMQKDGSIVFDSSKLSSATSADFASVATLVASFGKAAKTLTGSMLGTTGSITAATTGAQQSIKSIDSQREVLSRRLVQIEARYKRQFSSLDTLISSMNTTSTYLTQQLANLPGVSSK